MVADTAFPAPSITAAAASNSPAAVTVVIFSGAEAADGRPVEADGDGSLGDIR
jgi:hypothetical protein